MSHETQELRPRIGLESNGKRPFWRLSVRNRWGNERIGLRSNDWTQNQRNAVRRRFHIGQQKASHSAHLVTAAWNPELTGTGSLCVCLKPGNEAIDRKARIMGGPAYGHIGQRRAGTAVAVWPFRLDKRHTVRNASLRYATRRSGAPQGRHPAPTRAHIPPPPSRDGRTMPLPAHKGAPRRTLRGKRGLPIRPIAAIGSDPKGPRHRPRT